MAKTVSATIMLHQKEMQQEREFYEDRDELVAQFVNPRRELIKDSQRFDDKGERRGKRKYNDYAGSALSTWANGMQGHMISKSLRWFKAQLGEPMLGKNDEVQAWLQVYDEAMYAEFDRSNLYSVLPEWFRDAGSIATAILYAEENIGNGNVVYTPIHLREILISENAYGEVDTVHRKFFLTARQAVQKFNKKDDVLSQTIKDNAENHPEKKHEFIHAVFPRTERMYGSLLSINKPIASVYLEVSGGDMTKPNASTIRESGYDLNPYTVWRLRKNSDEIYGYSHAHDAMDTIMGSNQYSKTMIEAAHLAVKPALNVPERMRGNTRILPNGHNYYEKGGDKITHFGNQANYPVGIDREERMQKAIEDVYQVPFFLILARAEREMTATEIMERKSEQVISLGPQIDRLEDEGLSSVFNIQSDIADKAGRLPEPPQIVIDAVENAAAQGKLPVSIGIRFTGPLAIAREMAFKMQPINNSLAALERIAVLFPNALKKIKEMELTEEALDANNFPSHLMRSDEEVEAMIQAEQELIQQQQAMEMAGGMAESYPKLTGAPEDGSPAQAIGEQIGA